MSDKKRKVPKLRFPGFTDAWEQRKLGEVSDKFDNLRIPIAAQLRASGPTPYYGANGIQDYVDGFTHDGEFILLAEDGANSIYDYPVHYVNGKIWVNNHAHVLQAKEGTANNLFLLVSLKSINMEPYLVGGGRVKLNADVMMKLPIEVPSIQEQVILGGFFNTLNNLISLHQRKLDNVKMLKKSLLQKLFPKDGEKIPELRFPGFIDDWEQRKLGEVVFRRNAAEVTGALPGVEYEDVIPEEGRLNKNVSLKEVTKKGLEFLEGDVLFGKLRPYLKNWLFAEFNGVAVGDWWVLYSDKVDGRLIYYLIQTDSYQTVANLSTGTKMPRSDWTTVSQTIFAFPVSADEQLKIGKYFSSIDSLISLHQRKLDHLKELKKGLLQQMFV